MHVLVIGDNRECAATLRAALGHGTLTATWHCVASVAAALPWLEHNPIPAVIVLCAWGGEDTHAAVALTDGLSPRAPVLVAGTGFALDDMLAWLRQGVAGCLPLPAQPAMIRAAVGTVVAGGRYIPPDMLERMIAALHHEMSPDDIDDSGTQMSLPLPATAPIIREESELLGISHRQYEILALLTRGLSIKSICQRLMISEGTAKTHVSALYRRLGARNRGEAIYIAAQRGARHLFNR